LVVQSKVKKRKWLNGSNGLMVVNAYNLQMFKNNKAFLMIFHQQSNLRTIEPINNLFY